MESCGDLLARNIETFQAVVDAGAAGRRPSSPKSRRAKPMRGSKLSCRSQQRSGKAGRREHDLAQSGDERSEAARCLRQRLLQLVSKAEI